MDSATPNSWAAPAEIFDAWLQRLNKAVAHCDAAELAGLFERQAYWKDMLALTWEYKTFFGPPAIRDAFAATAALAQLRNIRPAEDKTPPDRNRRFAQTTVEGFFEFDTGAGRGVGFARLASADGDPANARALHLLTALHHLHGFEDKVGARRPSGNKYSRLHSSENWRQRRDWEQAYADRDPEVVIVGAGQGGLMLGARLRQMGVDTLILERTPKVGDVWRNRYNNLTLHNELIANHFPYMQFPDNWPTWLPKDMLASFLEAYAEFQELNVWTATELVEASFDEATRLWQLTVRRPDGSRRALRVKHLVAAMGISGGLPTRPKLPGLAEFAGTVAHSAEFDSGANWAGKNTVVIGTGNSGHDIAQDLHVSGAATVTMIQRGPTCVVSLDPSAMISYAVYREGRPVEETDLMVATIPYPLLIETYQHITRKTNEHDRVLLDGLEAAGFRTYTGADETGFQLLYLRGAGGYYIDVGCSQLIIDRKVGLLQAEAIERFVPEGLRLKDGSTLPCDLVVLATGFESMQESIRRLLGDAVADRVGPVWGFDEDNNLRNMWKRTAQPGFWIMGGAIIEARLFSRFLALQIKASLEGLMPEADALPLRRRVTA